jgi:hypothetical protein
VRPFHNFDPLVFKTTGKSQANKPLKTKEWRLFTVCVGYRELANRILYNGITKLQSQGLKVPVIAKMLDVPVDTIKDILYKDKYPSFPKALKIIINGKMTESLQEIAELLNCAVVELPKTDPSDPLKIKQVAQTMKQFSEFIEVHAKAIEDGRITVEEKKELKEKGWKLIQGILQIILFMEV